MIIVKLYGGLGNQMFQYATAKALSIQNNTPLALDATHFDKEIAKETKRRYSLHIFPNIKEQIATVTQVNRLVPHFRNEFLNKLYKIFNKKIFNFNRHYKIEMNFAYTAISLPKDRNAYLDGHWQSDKYFDSVAPAIRHSFNLDYLQDDESLRPVLEMVRSAASVSIHVRRGDYVNNFHHDVVNLDYYKRAIARMVCAVTAEPVFFVFSDDIEWCKKNLAISYQHNYVDTGKDDHDIYLMSNCKYNIIANSSFSWWGAWLNKHTDKIVIAPQKWFADVIPKDLTPSTWITE